MSKYILLNQIIILKLLNTSKYPLSSVQISDFTTENHLMHFFTSRETVSGLAESGLLKVSDNAHQTLYELSEDGRTTLAAYEDSLPSDIIVKIKDYLSSNDLEIKKNKSLKAAFDHNVSGGYICMLKAFEEENEVFSLSLAVPSEEMALTVCKNWKTKNEDVYEHILDLLL